METGERKPKDRRSTFLFRFPACGFLILNMTAFSQHLF